MNIAIILAGGDGVRTGFEKPKQLIRLGGISILERTINVFYKSIEIDKIIVVSNNSYFDEIEIISHKSAKEKYVNTIIGGTNRNDSTYNALKLIKKIFPYSDEYKILIHDSVRPFLNNSIISKVIDKLDTYDTIDVAIPASDTIIEVIDNIISNIPKRENIFYGQTPQGFKFKILFDSYDKMYAKKNFLYQTDDCSVVLNYSDSKVYVVLGDVQNIKLTYKTDLDFMDKLLQNGVQNIQKDSIIQFENKVIVIFGGNSGIGSCISKLLIDKNATVITLSTQNGFDIRNFNSIDYELNRVFEKYGRIDFIINTIADITKGELENLDNDSIVNSFSVNLVGASIIMSKSIFYLKKSEGMLINFASSSYTYGRELYSLYSSSKSAIVNLTQALSVEWAKYNAKINCVNPERTNTILRKNFFGDEYVDSLLDPVYVALKTIDLMSTQSNGIIYDIKKL